jgi:hypothetical protein
VLFFFVTGVGYGIQSSQKKKANHWYVTFNKVIILWLADLLSYWSAGQWLGLDFLGFIAFSSLVLELLRNSKFPVAYAIAGLVSVSLMRYLLGSYIQALGYDTKIWSVVGWILGTSGTPGVSYPLSPWLAYPFLGYLVGVTTMQYRNFIEIRRSQIVSGLLILTAFPALTAIIMSRHGFSFFRWGTVAIGFYIASFAIIILSIAWSLVIYGNSRLKIYQNALSLRGIASLAVVPIHYCLIYLVNLGVGKSLGLFSFCLIAIAVCTMSFLIARFVEKLSQILHKVRQQRIVWSSLVVMFLLATSLTLIYSRESTSLVILTRTWGQIVLCLLLVIRLPV